MRRLLLAPALLALAFLLLQPAALAGSRLPAPSVDARSYLVMNGASGDVLLSKNASKRGAKRRYPRAPITPLFYRVPREMTRARRGCYDVRPRARA